jgi:hypothetical protein
MVDLLIATYELNYKKGTLGIYSDDTITNSKFNKYFDSFFAQHVFEVAQDHAAGVFSGTDEVIEKITGHKPMVATRGANCFCVVRRAVMEWTYYDIIVNINKTFHTLYT